MRKKGVQHLVGTLAVVLPRGFDQCDGFGEGATPLRAIGTENGLNEPVVGGKGSVAQRADTFRICSNTSLALAGIGVPGP